METARKLPNEWSVSMLCLPPSTTIKRGASNSVVANWALAIVANLSQLPESGSAAFNLPSAAALIDRVH
ncbi:MAG: hypothetical protein AB7O96_16460 [Pseudobdellovibrionaceae bacterium]